MAGAVVGGLVGAMTVAVLAFSSPSGDTGTDPGSRVAVSGSQVVVVVGGDPSGGSPTAGTLRCPPPADRSAVPVTPVAPFLAVQRMLCVLPTVPADIDRLAFPPIVPWLGLMHF